MSLPIIQKYASVSDPSAREYQSMISECLALNREEAQHIARMGTPGSVLEDVVRKVWFPVKTISCGRNQHAAHCFCGWMGAPNAVIASTEEESTWICPECGRSHNQ